MDCIGESDVLLTGASSEEASAEEGSWEEAFSEEVAAGFPDSGATEDSGGRTSEEAGVAEETGPTGGLEEGETDDDACDDVACDDAAARVTPMLYCLVVFPSGAVTFMIT